MNLTPEEIEQVQELKKDFEASIEYVDYVLKDKDGQTNLDYLVRDWHTEPTMRNDVIYHRMLKLASALKRIEGEEIE